MAANVTNYSAWRVDATTGRVEINGTGFGETEGKVTLVQTGKHQGAQETVVSWTDTKIVVATPANVQYRHFMVKPATGPTYTQNNMNPLLATTQLRGLIVSEVLSPANNTIRVEGSGLLEIQWLNFQVHDVNGNARHQTYYNPAGPWYYMQAAPGATTNEWSDTGIEIHNVGDMPKDAVVESLSARNLAFNEILVLDFPDVTIDGESELALGA